VKRLTMADIFKGHRLESRKERPAPLSVKHWPDGSESRIYPGGEVEYVRKIPKVKRT
jgi:hypothetical protein